MDRLHVLLESSYISVQSFHLYCGPKRHFLLEEMLPVLSVFIMFKLQNWGSICLGRSNRIKDTITLPKGVGFMTRIILRLFWKTFLKLFPLGLWRKQVHPGWWVLIFNREREGQKHKWRISWSHNIIVKLNKVGLVLAKKQIRGTYHTVPIPLTWKPT